MLALRLLAGLRAGEADDAAQALLDAGAGADTSAAALQSASLALEHIYRRDRGCGLPCLAPALTRRAVQGRQRRARVGGGAGRRACAISSARRARRAAAPCFFCFSRG